MADKTINVAIALKDKFTKPLEKTTKSVKAQERQLKSATNAVGKWGQKANSAFLGAVKSAGKAALAMSAIGSALSVASLTSFASESMELAKAQIDAETKLEAVLGNIPSIAQGGAEAITAAKNQLADYAGQLQAVGVIGDEVTLSGMQQLATFQLSAESIQTLSGGMLDLLAQQKGLNATQQDAVGVANMIGKAMSGQASALSRVGIIMDDYQKKVIETGTESERAAMLAKVLQQNVGGVNAALANTDQGKIQQAANAYGDFQEEVGKKLLTLKARLADVFVQYLPTIQQKVLAAVDVVSAKFDVAMAWFDKHKQTIVSAVQTVWKVVSGVVGGIAKHLDVIIPLLAGVGAGFAAFNVLSKITAVLGVVGKFAGAIRTAGGAMKFLNIVMAANPLGVVAIAIGVVAAALVLAYKKSETFRNFVNKLWSTVKTAFGGMVNKVKTVASVFKTAFGQIKSFVQPVVDWLLEKFESIKGYIDTIKKGGEAVKEFFSGSGTSDPGHLRGNATGTSYFSGGLTRINEGRRGEIVNLPNGTQIIPHDVAVKQQQGGGNITVNLTVAGNVIGNREFMERTGEYIVQRIQLAGGVI